ncbi:MAG: hypothetical protein JWM80_4101 [Cyanobacteria bacterium RYN_339]|nr:hypothetical protein [Cyanobacteria bacterium RYN_339]
MKVLHTTLAATALLLTACGHAGAPGAALVTSPIAAAPTAALVAGHTARLNATPTVTIIQVRADDQVVAQQDALPEDPTDLMPRFMVAADKSVTDFKSDHTPYLPVVTERGAHYVTIAWHTEVETSGVVEYGRSWQFDQHGYTDKFTDEAFLTDHMITLTDLKRWTGYEFRVTGGTRLGLTFPEQQRSFRTKFWAWR